MYLALQVRGEGESVTRHAKGYRVSNHLEGNGNRVLHRNKKQERIISEGSDHYRTFSLVASFCLRSHSPSSLFHVILQALFEVLQLGSSYSPYFRRLFKEKETLLICLSEASFSF